MTNTTTQKTVRELVPALGSTVLVRFEQLTIEATVVDAKNSWNKVRLLVEPLAGTGQQWIELGRLVARPAADTCSLCGEAHVDHRAASDNSAAFCRSLASRPGDRFVRGPREAR